MTARRIRLLLLAAIAASGCTPDDVVARVGARNVTREALAAFERNAALPQGAKPLDVLVDRELLAAAAQGAGLAERPEVKARLEAAEREILAQAWLDAQLSKIGDAQALARFDAKKDALRVRQVHLAHIYLALPDQSPVAVSQVESRANGAWARLLGGEDFAQVAKDVSQDSATADKGGDLGVVREGQVAQEVFDAAAALPAGPFSRPGRTPFGRLLLRAVAAGAPGSPTFDEVKGKLIAELRREAEVELLASLRKSVTVRTFPERLGAEGTK